MHYAGINGGKGGNNAMSHGLLNNAHYTVTGWQSLAVLRLALVVILVVAVIVQISVPI